MTPSSTAPATATRAWPEEAPFDGILVTAAAEKIPEALVDQLAPGGRMILPVGRRHDVQNLILVEKAADGAVRETRILPVAFVPLVAGAGRAET